ncbi:MAG: hypothetical protein SF053_20470 [Bacteroidia bacterium]|nr:hypothetical protein [Bacteroidia bacterium]
MADRNKYQANSQTLQVAAGDWRKKVEQEYTYCMISTLNQMVNYLPLLLFDFQQTKMYLTLAGKLNESYDKYLDVTCSGLYTQNGGSRFLMPSENEKVKIGDLNNVGALQSLLSQKANGKKILWNITGGQRPFMMTIFELLKEDDRKNDLVMYLEGNAGKVVFLEVGEDNALQEVPAATHGFESYAVRDSELQWLNIRIALQLMGVEVADYKNSFMVQSEISSIIEKYRRNDGFRKRLLALNKKFDLKAGNLKGFLHQESYNGQDLLYIEPEKGARFYDSRLWKFEESKRKSCLLKPGDEAYLGDPEYIFFTLSENYQGRTYPFGHLLEDMFAQKLWNLLDGRVADFALNLKLKAAEDSGETTDEIDIAVLTKTGQLVVFEVKSGAMSGDVAKSTKYTTYAVAGVYGKPVLLTALLKSQLTDSGKLSNDWAYGSSASAVAAAKRAQLHVISLDGNEDGDFDTVIKKLLHLS